MKQTGRFYEGLVYIERLRFNELSGDLFNNLTVSINGSKEFVIGGIFFMKQFYLSVIGYYNCNYKSASLIILGAIATTTAFHELFVEGGFT